jgi:hypothetical protein
VPGRQLVVRARLDDSAAGELDAVVELAAEQGAVAAGQLLACWWDPMTCLCGWRAGTFMITQGFASQGDPGAIIGKPTRPTLMPIPAHASLAAIWS